MLTQTPIPIYTEAETFYVPYFEVKIEGRKLPQDVVRDVMQVTYKDNVEQIDSFDMTVGNWDSEQAQPQPKYEPPSRPEYDEIFAPGQKLELWMGYVDNLRLMQRCAHRRGRTALLRRPRYQRKLRALEKRCKPERNHTIYLQHT